MNSHQRAVREAMNKPSPSQVAPKPRREQERTPGDAAGLLSNLLQRVDSLENSRKALLESNIGLDKRVHSLEEELVTLKKGTALAPRVGDEGRSGGPIQATAATSTSGGSSKGG